MLALDNPIRGYAWGSHTVIAHLQGRPTPTEEPEAELWIGAHPSAPSRLPDGSSLADVIAAAPERVLGAPTVARFGPRLPFLLKVLAAAEPLSLQAHPTLAQARAGFAAGDPNYVDANHKPELLVAIEPMAALCGFRDPLVSADRIAALAIPDLAPVVALLRRGDLREAVGTLLSWPEDQRHELIGTVAKGARLLPGPDADVVELLAAKYPQDLGVLVSLLLNHVTLQPGEAIWMPAGNLHAYLHGAGVEIMAASDNVLRGGLTPKRVDVAELLRVVRFEVLDSPLFPAVESEPGQAVWAVPVPDFALHRIAVAGDPVTLTVAGPRTLLCLGGTVTVADDAGSVTLTGGRAAFSGAADGDLHVTGDGDLYLATVGALTE
ncbi:mannose-6-phosphate isomerase [Allocatelliglobosispora scoriae]|uniref:mannose-6-phosphate isomerase n=1 Tax=Allocatelliglobosispora scoriae TaxID=643052 RepID=A0A841BSU0_9ACTN|nr:mannose-6-phosphate isomerase, class I [Allocatelliglobosispora scoriae]MBB5870249.1 mannose-6-phosphate isomerase [Allocatelliglobosispora scoriae]